MVHFAQTPFFGSCLVEMFYRFFRVTRTGHSSRHAADLDLCEIDRGLKPNIAHTLHVRVCVAQLSSAPVFQFRGYVRFSCLARSPQSPVLVTAKLTDFLSPWWPDCCLISGSFVLGFKSACRCHAVFRHPWYSMTINTWLLYTILTHLSRYSYAPIYPIALDVVSCNKLDKYFRIIIYSWSSLRRYLLHFTNTYLLFTNTSLH